MKKTIATFIFVFGFGAYGFATNKIELSTVKQQEPKKTEKQKAEKYDFSLFKFLRSAPKLMEKKDSTQMKEESNVPKSFNDQTTDHQLIPRDFFKFS